MKAELYGGTARGWVLVQDLIVRIGETHDPGIRNPVAWGYGFVKEELEALRRDFGSGRAGVVLR